MAEPTNQSSRQEMSNPIFVKTPQPDTEERLVLVPPGAVVREYESQAGPRFDLLGCVARDATPDDLARGGYVPLAAFVGPLDMLSPPTLAGALEAIHSVREAVATVDNMTGGRSTGEGSEDGGPWRAYGEPTDQELVDAFEHAYSNAPSVRTHATAIRTIYRLGVAHERARQQPEKDRATDEELVDLYRKIYETHGGLTIDVSHGDCRRAAVRAVAAHVRQERCLVAQAVAAGADVRIEETPRNYGASFDGWTVSISTRGGPGVTFDATHVPAAEVPATLARLLGEVSR